MFVVILAVILKFQKLVQSNVLVLTIAAKKLAEYVFYATFKMFLKKFC